MAITFTGLTASNFVTLDYEKAVSARTLVLDWWRNTWDDSYAEQFFFWRYCARPDGDTILAFDGKRCVAILDSFIRPYLIGGRCVRVHETADWFCQPEYRRFGVGIQLMQKMMAKGQPIVSVAGTDTTLALLPRLRWQRLPDASNYILPARVGATLDEILRHLPFALAGQLGRSIGGLSLKLPLLRRLPPPAQNAGVSVLGAAEVVPLLPPADQYALASLIGESEAQWLAAAPKEEGDFIWLGFTAGEAVIGLSLSRLETGRNRRRARILHLHMRDMSPGTAGWVVSATAQHLMERGAGVIFSRASCPVIGAALQKAGFLRWRPSPTYWWPAGHDLAPGPVHLTLHRADDGLLPYPTCPT